jgi:hypothetical protein
LIPRLFLFTTYLFLNSTGEPRRIPSTRVSKLRSFHKLSSSKRFVRLLVPPSHEVLVGLSRFDWFQDTTPYLLVCPVSVRQFPTVTSASRLRRLYSSCSAHSPRGSGIDARLLLKGIVYLQRQRLHSQLAFTYSASRFRPTRDCHDISAKLFVNNDETFNTCSLSLFLRKTFRTTTCTHPIHSFHTRHDPTLIRNYEVLQHTYDCARARHAGFQRKLERSRPRGPGCARD